MKEKYYDVYAKYTIDGDNAKFVCVVSLTGKNADDALSKWKKSVRRKFMHHTYDFKTAYAVVNTDMYA